MRMVRVVRMLEEWPRVRCAVRCGTFLLVLWGSVGTAWGQETPTGSPQAAESGARGESPAPPPVPAVAPATDPPPPEPLPATEPPSDRKPLTVLVTTSSASVPREAFLAALQKTLRRPLVASASDVPGGEELSVRYDEQASELMVSCYSADSGPVTRVIEAPKDPASVPEAAALLAENLCALDPVVPATGAAPSAPPVVPVAAAPVSPQVAVVEAPYDHTMAVAGAFYPFATNYGRPNVSTNFEFNLIYGRVGALEGIGLGTIHWIDGEMSGLVVGGLLSVVSGRASGLMVSGLANSAESLDVGVSLSTLFNHAHGLARGGQVSFGLNFAGPVEGAQLAGLGNVARGPVQGVQVAAATNVAGNIEGMQISLVNVGGDVTGAQVGLVNVADHVRGMQVGLVNVSDDVEGVPLGLFNVSRSGGVHVPGWFSTTTHANLGVKFATRYTYSMITLGYHRDREEDLDLFGGGLVLGFRIPAAPQLAVAVDIGGDYLLGARICCYETRTEERIAHTNDRNHFRLRVLPTWQVQEHVALFAGPAIALRVPFALYSQLEGYNQDVELLPEFDVGFEL